MNVNVKRREEKRREEAFVSNRRFGNEWQGVNYMAGIPHLSLLCLVVIGGCYQVCVQVLDSIKELTSSQVLS